MNPYAYLIVRLCAGMSMFGHGLVRLPKLNAFSEGITAAFAGSMLPEVLVMPFCYALPFVELIIGVFLLLGWYTRLSALAGGLLMVLLIMGSTLIEDWGGLPTQFIHAAFFAVILQFLPDNRFAVDNYRR